MNYVNIGIYRTKAAHLVMRAMTLHRIAAMVLFALFAFVLPLAHAADAVAEEEEGVTGGNPHDFTNVDLCFVCHSTNIPKLNFDPVTTCTRCHNGNIDNHPLTRHPIGVAPRINIPSNLPLTGDGRFVCYTCHDGHNVSNYKYMLRVEYARLCSSCHIGY